MRAIRLLTLTVMFIGGSLAQGELGFNYGGEFGLGQEVTMYDNTVGASYSDSIECNGCCRKEYADSNGRDIGGSVTIAHPFGDPVSVGLGANYRMERYLLWEDGNGAFILKNKVKLYINVNGHEHEIVIEAGLPYIYMYEPCF